VLKKELFCEVAVVGEADGDNVGGIALVTPVVVLEVAILVVDELITGGDVGVEENE
jgi:hypothetical protein